MAPRKQAALSVAGGTGARRRTKGSTTWPTMYPEKPWLSVIMNAGDRRSRRLSGFRGDGVTPGAVVAGYAQAPDHRQLERGREGVDPEGEAEHVHLQALAVARKHAEQPVEGELQPAAARRPADHAVTDKVLADGGRGQVEPELRHGARDPGGEGVRGGARPQPVLAGVGIVARGARDAFDHGVHTLAAPLGEQLRLVAEPAPVGRTLMDHERRVAPPQAPADDLVHGVGRS